MHFDKLKKPSLSFKPLTPSKVLEKKKNKSPPGGLIEDLW